MATQQEIRGWLSANPGATDQQIAQAMQQYNVPAWQMADALGIDVAQAQTRFSTKPAAPVAPAAPITIGNGTSKVTTFIPGTNGSDKVWTPVGTMGNGTSRVVTHIPGTQTIDGRGTPMPWSTIDPTVSAAPAAVTTTAAPVPATTSVTAAPSYTADQIKAYADNILSQGGSYEDVAKAAQQFGVPLNDVFGAYGMNQAQGQQFLIDQGLRDYIQPGTVDPSIINSTVQSYLQNPNLNDQQRSQALGSLASQYGVSNDQIAQATGYSLPQVQSYASLATAQQAAPVAPSQPARPVAPDLTTPYTPSGTGYDSGTGTVGATPGPTAGSSVLNYANTTPDLGGGYGGGFGGGGMGTPANPYGTGQGTFSQMYGGYQASPWLSATADELGRRTQQALGQAFNGIRSNAVGVGGLGGSRQGVAEGQAISNAMDSLQGNLAGMFAQDWTQAQNRGLQARGQDQGFTLGLGGLANQRTGMNMNYDLGLGNQYLTGRGQDMSMYNTNRSLDLQQLGLGADIYDKGVRGGWMPLTTAGGLFNSTAGNNVTQTNGSNAGGGWGGAVGGLLAGGSLAQQAGWWKPWA